MASCKVRLKKFKWSPAGYTQVKDGGKTQAILAS